MKKTLKKIWHFIWDDDSIWSWIVNVILAFVLIKYILYPGIGFLLSTSHPVVAVVSGSMEHKTDSYGLICGAKPDKFQKNFQGYWDICKGYYSQYNITDDDFKRFYFKNGFNTGDIIVLVGRKPEKINVGDVIVFRGAMVNPKSDPIIHRIVEKKETENGFVFHTKGDHNSGSIDGCESDGCIYESSITESQVIGKAVFRIPALGYIKIWFVKLLQVMGLGSSVGRLFQ